MWVLDEYTQSCTVSTKSEDQGYIIELKTIDVMVSPQLVPTEPETFQIEKKAGGEVFRETEITIDLSLGSQIPKDGILKFEFPPKIIFQKDQERPVCQVVESESSLAKIDGDVKIHAEDALVFGIREILIQNMCKQYFSQFCPPKRPLKIRISNILNAQSTVMPDLSQFVKFGGFTNDLQVIDVGDLEVNSFGQGLSLKAAQWQEGEIKVLEPLEGSEFKAGGLNPYKFSVYMETGLKSMWGRASLGTLVGRSKC